MTIVKHKYLKLVVDNTRIGKINALLKKQKTLINARLKLQKERKFIDELIKKWGDAIIKTENKIINLQRRENVTQRTKELRNVRASRDKTKNTTERTLR